MSRLQATLRPERPEPLRNPYFGSSEPIENEAVPAASPSAAPSLTIEPFIGYRLWSVVPGTILGDRPEHPILRSLTRGSIWEGADSTATCLARKQTGRPHPTEAVPAIGCGCGIYALKAPAPPPRPSMWAQGPTALSGRVLEGTLGYRAEHARILGPLRLFLGGPEPRCLKPLCRRPAEWVRVTARLYLPRCRDHLQPAIDGMIDLPLEEFRDHAAVSFAGRYDILLQGE